MRLFLVILLLTDNSILCNLPPFRHEVNCLTKEEFERSAKSPKLARQNSQVQSPLSRNLSFNEVIKSPAALGPNSMEASAIADAESDLFCTKQEQTGYGRNNEHINGKALALMVQPSVDYGKLLVLVLVLRELSESVYFCYCYPASTNTLVFIDFILSSLHFDHFRVQQ